MLFVPAVVVLVICIIYGLQNFVLATFAFDLMPTFWFSFVTFINFLRKCHRIRRAAGKSFKWRYKSVLLSLFESQI